MMKKKFTTTTQMLEALKDKPNVEHVYCHWLGGILFSTYWILYNTEKHQFGISTDGFRYVWYSEIDVLSIYAGHWWVKEDDHYC